MALKGRRVLPGKKGQVSTPDNPCGNEMMLWIRDVALKYEGDDCLIWPFVRNTTGYGRFLRQKKNYYAHRYICKLAHGEPPTPQHEAAHSCDNGPGGCVSRKHLSWKTGAENQLDRHRTGPWRKFKLTPAQADEIRALKGQEPTLATARRYGISETHARQIQSGLVRGASRFRQFTDNEIRAIRIASAPATKVAAEYGVSASAIHRIRKGQAYGHVEGMRRDE